MDIAFVRVGTKIADTHVLRPRQIGAHVVAWLSTLPESVVTLSPDMVSKVVTCFDSPFSS